MVGADVGRPGRARGSGDALACAAQCWRCHTRDSWRAIFRTCRGRGDGEGQPRAAAPSAPSLGRRAQPAGSVGQRPPACAPSASAVALVQRPRRHAHRIQHPRASACARAVSIAYHRAARLPKTVLRQPASSARHNWRIVPLRGLRRQRRDDERRRAGAPREGEPAVRKARGGALRLRVLAPTTLNASSFACTRRGSTMPEPLSTSLRVAPTHRWARRLRRRSSSDVDQSHRSVAEWLASEAASSTRRSTPAAPRPRAARRRRRAASPQSRRCQAATGAGAVGARRRLRLSTPVSSPQSRPRPLRAQPRLRCPSLPPRAG